MGPESVSVNELRFRSRIYAIFGDICPGIRDFRPHFSYDRALQAGCDIC